MLDKEAETFLRAYSANVGKTMAVVLDDRVKSYARIQEPIRIGTDNWIQRREAASPIAETAALPINLSVVSQQSVGARDAIIETSRYHCRYSVDLRYVPLI